MSEELKPCPFCGGSNITEEASISVVFCADCGGEKDTDMGSWNTRPIEDALTARIAELEAERRWIPVSERLPEEDVRVLLYSHGVTAVTAVGWIRKFEPDISEWECWDDKWSSWDTPTHWMPLPNPPEVK